MDFHLDGLCSICQTLRLKDVLKMIQKQSKVGFLTDYVLVLTVNSQKLTPSDSSNLDSRFTDFRSVNRIGNSSPPILL